MRAIKQCRWSRDELVQWRVCGKVRLDWIGNEVFTVSTYLLLQVTPSRWKGQVVDSHMEEAEIPERLMSITL
jgi:hypothetical protein